MTGWWLQPPGKCLPFYKCRKTLETWNHRPKVRICGFCAGIRARLLKQPSSKTSRLQQHDLPSPNLELGPHFQLHWPFLIKSCFLQVLNINKKRKKTAHKKTAKIIHGIPLLTRTLHSLVQKRVSTTTPKHVTSKISHPYQAHPLKCSLKSLPTQPTPPKKHLWNSVKNRWVRVPPIPKIWTLFYIVEISCGWRVFLIAKIIYIYLMTKQCHCIWKDIDCE